MYCPKCGRENPDDARICSACNSELPAHKKVNVKTSKLAVAAFILAIASVVTFGITAIPAIILGIISLIFIEASGGRLAGKGFAVVGIVLPVVTLALFWPLFRKARQQALRSRCTANLSQISRRTLTYSEDYDNPLPQAGGKGTTWWPRIDDWQAERRWEAFGMNKADSTGGRASISASFYLLVKYGEAKPEWFVCPADSGTTVFRPAGYGRTDEELRDFWDFGPEPWKHCSYTYHLPYSEYSLQEMPGPGMAMIADRSPWIDSPAERAKDFGKFDPNDLAPPEAQKHGNSPTHNNGQNVVFLDGHEAFERRAYCGIKDDNIYTFWPSADSTRAEKMRGRPPGPDSQPAGRVDSLLVHDPPMTEPK